MQLQILANAKINLTLHITGKQKDGYHTLDTIMQSVGLQDKITVSLTDSPSVSVTCSDDTLCGEQNLAYRAASLFLEAIHEKTVGVAIHIEKNIPLAGGLGGGSADAAAVLLGLNCLFGEPLDLAKLKDLALPLGADVPFCLVGGTCRATGIGEHLESLSSVENGWVLLVKPCEKESTAKMYQKYDEIKGLQEQEDCVIMNKVWSHELHHVCGQLHNDFLPLYEQSEITTAIYALRQGGAVGASLSGSGPTVFGLFNTEQEAKMCAQLPGIAEYDHWVAPLSRVGYEFI